VQADIKGVIHNG